MNKYKLVLNNQHKLILLPTRFYKNQALLLIASAIIFIMISKASWIDLTISRYWFDAVSQHFYLKDNVYLELINHKLIKYGIIILYVGLLIKGIVQHQHQLQTVVLLAIVSVITVALLKQFSLHACPWSLTLFGGSEPYIPLLDFQTSTTGLALGRCFPGGHASAGFSLFALVFLFKPNQRNRAIFLWVTVFIFGTLMGFGQVVRGAHFLTHNLWSAWWCWCSQVITYALLTEIFPRLKRWYQQRSSFASSL